MVYIKQSTVGDNVLQSQWHNSWSNYCTNLKRHFNLWEITSDFSYAGLIRCVPPPKVKQGRFHPGAKLRHHSLYEHIRNSSADPKVGGSCRLHAFVKLNEDDIVLKYWRCALQHISERTEVCRSSIKLNKKMIMDWEYSVSHLSHHLKFLEPSLRRHILQPVLHRGTTKLLID